MGNLSSIQNERLSQKPGKAFQFLNKIVMHYSLIGWFISFTSNAHVSKNPISSIKHYGRCYKL